MVELHRLDVVDWEPAVLHFHFSHEDLDHAARVQDYFMRWFQEGKASRSCACHLVFFVSHEWTSTFDENGKAIVRSGPKWARTHDWKERVRRHRGALDPEFYDLMTGFRVVRPRSSIR